jgi:hypothetical protein
MAPSTNASALTNGNAAARPTVLATAPPKLVERRGVAVTKRRVERRDVAVTKRRVERRDVAVTKRRVEHAT